MVTHRERCCGSLPLLVKGMSKYIDHLCKVADSVSARTLSEGKIPVWVPADKPWGIYIDKYGLVVENFETGVAEQPIIYSSGRVGYDRPEIIPSYIKANIAKLSRQYGSTAELCKAYGAEDAYKYLTRYEVKDSAASDVVYLCYETDQWYSRDSMKLISVCTDFNIALDLLTTEYDLTDEQVDALMEDSQCKTSDGYGIYIDSCYVDQLL